MNMIKQEHQRDSANLVLQLLVGFSIMGMVWYVIWVLTHVELKTNNNSALLVVLGAVLSWGGLLATFAFPGSIGTAKAADTINKLADKTPPFTGEAREALREDASISRAADAADAASAAAGNAVDGGLAPIPAPAASDADSGSFPAGPPAIDGVGEEAGRTGP